MSIADIILVIFFISGAIAGYQKGFLYSLFSLLAIFLGVLGGFKLMGVVMVKLSVYYEVDEKILPYVAFGVIFLLIVIVVRLLGNLLRSSMNKTFLGSADQWAGGLLGLGKTVFMVSVVLWITDSLSLRLPNHWIEDSYLYTFTANAAPVTTNWLGEWLPSFHNLFNDQTE